jgi:hypothetical protein
MDTDLSTPEAQLRSYQTRLASINSFIKELGDRTAECATEPEQYQEDLTSAHHTSAYYASQVELLSREVVLATPASTAQRMLVQGRAPSIGSFPLALISFVAGALLGSMVSGGKSQGRGG